MVSIPEEIEKCKNLELRNAGIAAYNRGLALNIKNKAFYQCVRFNAEAAESGNLEKITQEFEDYLNYFNQ